MLILKLLNANNYKFFGLTYDGEGKRTLSMLTLKK